MAFLLFCFVFAHGLLEAVCRSEVTFRPCWKPSPTWSSCNLMLFISKASGRRPEQAKHPRIFCMLLAGNVVVIFLKNPEGRGPRLTLTQRLCCEASMPCRADGSCTPSLSLLRVLATPWPGLWGAHSSLNLAKCLHKETGGRGSEGESRGE